MNCDAVRHGQCTRNTMWPSLRSKTKPYARNLSPKVMDRPHRLYHLPHPRLYLLGPDPLSLRSRGTHCQCGSDHIPMGHRHQLLIHTIIHLPNVSPSSEQEQYHCLCGCSLVSGPRVLVVAPNGSFRFWNHRCYDLDARCLLVA